MKRIIALLLALLMVGAVLAACGGQNTDNTAKATEAATADEAVADLAKVTAAGKLVVGITDFEPMDYQDESGKWIGFDADMAKGFAESLGVDVEFVEIDWDNKVLELDGGTVDCIWNGMTLTPEVLSAMSCSAPYMFNSQVVVVKSDAAGDIKEAADCKGLTFAVESGSAGQEQAELQGYTFTEVKDQATALMEVASGTRDAAIIDLLMASAMIGEGTSYPQLTHVVNLNEEQYGVGFRKGSDLTKKLDEYIVKSYQDGTIDSVAEKYGVKEALIK